MEIDIHNKENYLSLNKKDVGFGAKAMFAGKNARDVCFHRDCRNFLIILCERLNIKSPLRKRIVKGFSCLSPDVTLSPVLNRNRIKILLTELIRLNQIRAVNAEAIQKEYLLFCENEFIQSSLHTFNKTEDRLDVV